MGKVVLSTEGSGANVKYYAQLGADTASKKPLGRPEYIDFEVSTTYPMAAQNGYQGGISDIDGDIFSAVDILSASTHVIYSSWGQLTSPAGQHFEMSPGEKYYIQPGTVGQGRSGTQKATIRLYFR